MLTGMPDTGWLAACRYRVLSLIGQGGQSRVYLALDQQSGKKRVIKELREDITDVPAARRALLLEGELLSKLHHPGLPAACEIADRGEKAPLLIIREYVEGTSLWHLVRRDGPMKERKVLRLGLQICRILSYLHAQDPPVIYRDLKPGNLLLSADGHLTLIDFGCARYLRTGSSGHPDTIPLGTPGYAAPEQFGADASTDCRTDIYGLGVTLFELLTGKNPVSLTGRIPPVRTLRPDISPALEKIVFLCTSPDPSDRFQNCAELEKALKSCLIRDPVRLLAKSGRHLALAAALFATILLGALAHPRMSLAGEENIVEDPAIEEPVAEEATLDFYREMNVLIRSNRTKLRDSGLTDEEMDEILLYIASQLEDADG